MNKLTRSKQDKLFQEIAKLIENSRRNVISTINREMVILYWNVGNIINTDIIKNNRADYGKQVIKELSKQLTLYYGKGFNETNLRNFIKFVQVFPSREISHTLCEKLSWSHIRELIYIENAIKREFYLELCAYERWSVRTLKERMNSMLFERTAISKKPEQTIKNDLLDISNKNELSHDLTFRDPYVLDFLELHDTYSEKDLENAILYKMKEFLVEVAEYKTKISDRKLFANTLHKAILEAKKEFADMADINEAGK